MNPLELFCQINFSTTDVITLISVGILLLTLLQMKRSNDENTRLNRLQQAENTIIKLMEFQNDLLNGIRVNYADFGMGFGYPDAPTLATGQAAFELFFKALKNNYLTMPGNKYKNERDIDAEENRIKDSFTALYNEHGSVFGNYFKSLYLIIKYIKGVRIKGFDSRLYISIVKSQLSKFQILLLGYDCIWIQNKPKGLNFIELAKDTNLLSALETDELIESVSKVSHLEIFRDKYGIDFESPNEFTN